MLLEEIGTGEPVVLCRRLWKGITCSCFEPGHENPQLRCPKCFVPGTLVRAESGWKAIEQVKIGERVLSSDGTYQIVTNIFKFSY